MERRNLPTFPVRWETGQPPWRTFGEWHEDPWADPADKERRRREDHARWLASISERDWRRLTAAAERTLAGERLCRFDDLDAPIAIGLCHPLESHPPNGERFGELNGCVLMAWRKARPRR
jgi:hypothetical protein